MAAVARGHVDFGAPGFIARFVDEHEPAITQRIKAIQRRHWLESEKVWVIEPHWPSVHRLLYIACELGWEITPAARAAEQRVREDDEALEYSVDVVHNAYGEAVFQCKAGEDDALHAKLRALPGAYWEDAWCVPTDWERCCGPLLEIVESDPRLTYSNAAWTLLTEPDVTHLYVRSSAPPAAASFQLAAPPPATRAPALPWSATEREREMQAWSRATSAEDFSPSAALRGTLLPFQVAGVRYILEARRVLLADDAGLGKTAQALAALETASAYPALVVCPPDQLPVWQAEAERWLPASRKVVSWPAELTDSPDVLLINYASLAHHQQALGAHGFAAIVADESHYLRHHASRRTQAVLAVAARVTGLRLCLSRERLSRQPIELATQLAFLGVLGSHFGGFWDFAHRYCAPQQTEGGTIFGAHDVQELAERLRASCYCRRERAGVLDQLQSIRPAGSPERRRKPRIQSRSTLPTRADDEKQVS